MTASKSGSEPGASLTRIRIAGLATALVAALLLALTGDALRRPVFDAWQKLSPRDLSDTQVRVVEIDADSLAALGGWPWSRYHVARLTEEIAKRGALAIGFDIIFAQEDPLAPAKVAALFPEFDARSAARLGQLRSNDDLLSEAMGKARVSLARAGTDDGQGGVDPAELTEEATIVGRLPPATPTFPRAQVSIPQLEFVARGFGLITAEPDADGVQRKVPLVGKLGEKTFPGFSLDLVRVARNLDTIRMSEDSAQLGATRIPLNRNGEMRLRFGRLPPSAIVSAADLIRQGRPADEFAGKVVLVGLATEGSEDVVTTPIDRATFGIYLHAQAADAILRGSGWLERPVWASAAEWLAGILLVLLVVYALPRRGPLQFVVPAVAFLLLGVTWFAFDQASLLLDPLRPLLLGGMAAFGVGAASYTQTRGERERLREALVQERIEAARTEAEMDQARGIQLGMLPPPGSLAAIDPRLEVAALLEPARSVGGDFYDAIRLDADRIAFCIADVTGKGVPAALFMALSKALARAIIQREPQLDVAASMLNEELMRDGIDSGLTMLLGVIDLSSGELALVSAGHDDPFRIERSGRVEELKLDGGPPFCIVDFPWPVERVRLAPGEALVLVTDGVSEAQTSAGHFFGRERSIEALGGLGNASATSMAARLVEAVRAFEAGAEASDDLTVMVLRYLG